jgi:dephospho-CoA kinase
MLLQERFGRDIMNGSEVDKKRLRALVFSDPEKLMVLNRMSHPILVKKILECVENIETGVVVIDAALMFDWKEVYEIVDYPILVTADRDKRRLRARAKGVEEELFDRITAVQKDEAEMAQMAKYVIENNGTVAELKEKCLKIYKEINNDR